VLKTVLEQCWLYEQMLALAVQAFLYQLVVDTMEDPMVPLPLLREVRLVAH
jgi:hypothetical protein